MGEPTVRGHRAIRRAPMPVFVDRSGHRRRVVMAASAAGAVAVLLALTMLIAGLFGASPLPLPGLPDLGGPATTTPAPGPIPSAPNQSAPTQREPQPAPEPTPPSSAGPPSASPGLPSNANATSPPRHIPTQTPPDPGRPTRT